MTAQIIALTVLVVGVGLPHGGLDHRFGRALLRPALGWLWMPAFFTGYLTVMAVVLVGWWLAPLLTLAGFVALSAVHFGTAEADSDSSDGLFRTALFGGMVVWMPAFAQPAEFTQLLTWVVPGGHWPQDTLFRPAVRAGLAALLAIAIPLAFATSLWRGMRVVGFATLFAILPPLVSFLIYFCLWHSGVELYRLARRANPQNVWLGLARVAREAFPLASVSALIIAVAWWAGATDLPLTHGLVRAIFVGLSVVAVPHLLLHWATARRDVNPFSEVDP